VRALQVDDARPDLIDRSAGAAAQRRAALRYVMTFVGMTGSCGRAWQEAALRSKSSADL
jgi:hypothetical protein